MEMIYEYLTGPRFRQRIQAIVEAFSAMQDDLNQEKKASRGSRRRGSADRAGDRVDGGLYWDLQGIAGKAVGEIEGLGIAGMLEVSSD